MYIDGKVQISIEDCENMKAAAEAKEQAEKQAADMANSIADIVMVKDADFEEEMERIDRDKSLTDKQISKRVSEAYSLLKIAVDQEGLKKLIRRAFKVQKRTENGYADIKNATNEELERVKIELEGGI